MVKRKWTNSNVHNTTWKTKDRAPPTPLKTRGEVRKGKPFLLHMWHPSWYACYKPGDTSKLWIREKNRMGITTNGTYPWSFVTQIKTRCDIKQFGIKYQISTLIIVRESFLIFMFSFIKIKENTSLILIVFPFNLRYTDVHFQNYCK